MDNINSEFKVFGRNIENISIFYGLFLILWGLVVSFISKSSSFTSYIPSIFGVMIFLFSYFSIKFTSQKKILMHIVALLGLLTFLGGLDIIRLIFRNSMFDNLWADLSKLMMLITGFCFIVLCFKSFRYARNVISSKDD